MVPTLQVPKDALKSNGFINAYIQDVDKDHQYKDSVYLLFKPKDLDKFREFLDNEYERTKSIIEDYDYEDGYVVIVYQLNEKYKKDFELIKEGKYSQTSDTFKNVFPKTVKISKNGLSKEEISLQYRIFNKSEDLLEFWENKLNINLKEIVGANYEVWEGWDEIKEILNIKTIIKNV